jgi:hypothetical protein
MDAADVLAAVIAHPTLWPTVEDLAGATGARAAEVERAVADLTAAGWVEPWDAGSIDWSIDPVDLLADAPGGPLRWVLTPLAAERLGLRLDADSARWVPAAAPAEPPRKARRGRTVCETDLNGEPDDPGPLDSFPDPGAADPAEAVAAAEEVEGQGPPQAVASRPRPGTAPADDPAGRAADLGWAAVDGDEALPRLPGAQVDGGPILPGV